jgi:hypothetical protein
MEVD